MSGVETAQLDPTIWISWQGFNWLSSISLAKGLVSVIWTIEIYDCYIFNVGHALDQ